MRISKQTWSLRRTAFGAIALISVVFPYGGADAQDRTASDIAIFWGMDEKKPAQPSLFGTYIPKNPIYWPSYIGTVAGWWVWGERAISPLVLDLDGDGVEVSRLNTANAVYFDLDLDNFGEDTGFVIGGDGLLALDVNNNGLIDNASELFGDQTGFDNGFLALAVHDNNSDGKITSDDPIFNSLLIWREIVLDGKSGNDELQTLRELGVSSIDLDYTEIDVSIEGNAIKQISKFSIDGVSRDIADVLFVYDDLDTFYVGPYELDPAVLSMPSLRGYGIVPDLRIGMSLDNDGAGSGSLKSLISSLVTKDFLDLFPDDRSILDLVKSILFRWARVDGIDVRSRSGNSGLEDFDSREIEFMERFLGRDFLQRGYISDPYFFAARHLQAGFDIALQAIYARLLLQANGRKLVIYKNDSEDAVGYNIATDSIDGISGIDPIQLAALEAKSATMADKQLFWQNVVRMIEFGVGVENLSAGDQALLDAAIRNSSGETLINLVVSLSFDPDTMNAIRGDRTLRDVLSGTAGRDNIAGFGGDDQLAGGLGDDILAGGSGADTLSGGGGPDLLFGGTGSDTYVYALGQSIDTLVEGPDGSDVDTIEFASGIQLEDLTLTRAGPTDLVIAISTAAGGRGRIVIEGQFNHTASGGNIELLHFADGSVFELESISYIANGTDRADELSGVTLGQGGLPNDTINGLGGDDVLNGLEGDDMLYGGDGDDIIRGGHGAASGNDQMVGGAGDDAIAGGPGNDTYEGGPGDDLLSELHGSGADTYIYNRGDGNDTIIEVADRAGEIDKIELGPGITADDLLFSRTGDDARIVITDSLGRPESAILLQDHVNPVAGSGRIEEIRFVDGTTLDLATIEIDVVGTLGPDMLSGAEIGARPDERFFGFGGNDTIDGRSGDDLIDAGEGDDIVLGGRGTISGNDRLMGGAGDDELSGGAGDDIYDGGPGDDLLTELQGGGADTYIFNRGDGSDTIVEFRDRSDEFDRIEFGPGIRADDLLIARSGNDVRIVLQDGAGTGHGTIVLQDQVKRVAGAGRIEQIGFMDGTTLDLTAIEMDVIGTEGDDKLAGAVIGTTPDERFFGLGGNDTIDGGSGDDVIEGGPGDDVIHGGDGAGSGNDRLIGGPGDDEMAGGSGDDTYEGGPGNDLFIEHAHGGSDLYIYNRGDGNDIIVEAVDSPAEFDTLRMGEGISGGDLALVRHENGDLQIHIAAGEDDDRAGNVLIRMQPCLGSGGGSIEEIELASGSRINPASVEHTVIASETEDGQTDVDGTNGIANVPAGAGADLSPSDAADARCR